MYFKFMQKVVAFFTALIATFIPATPAEGIDPTLPLKNVNPNEIADFLLNFFHFLIIILRLHTINLPCLRN